MILIIFLDRHYPPSSAFGQCVLLASVSCFYAIVRPYKLNVMNHVDILILFLLEILSLATTSPATTKFMDVNVIQVTTLVLGIPHTVLIFHVCYVLANKAGITQCLNAKYKTLKSCMQATRCASQAEIDETTDSDYSFLPDRLINPGEYEPLLPTTAKHTAAECTKQVNKEQRKLTPVYTYGSIN